MTTDRLDGSGEVAEALQSRGLIHTGTRAASTAWCTTVARSSRIESRSTASLSLAANAASAASASYRVRLNRRSTGPTQNWPICAPPAMRPPDGPRVQTRQGGHESAWRVCVSLWDLRYPAGRLGSVVGWDRGGWRLGLGGVCRVRGRRRTIAVVAEWWSIEVLHGEVSAFRWQEQRNSALIEAALTNGVRDGAWHADRWGVVFEVLFDAEDRWEAFRGLPVVRAALDAVPDPVNGLLIYRGRGGGAGTREPRRPKPAPSSAAVSLPGPADEPYLDLAAVSAPAARPTTAGALQRPPDTCRPGPGRDDDH